MSIVRRDQFLGVNNIAKPERLPDGAVADAVNFDFTVGGKAELRTGFTRIREGALRAVFADSDSLILISQSNIVRIRNGVESNLGPAPSGHVAATLHNAALYLNTPTASLEITDVARPWAAPAPSFDISLAAGSMKAGIYKVAVTSLVDGKESGAVPAIIQVADGQAVQVSGNGRLYMSAPNGQTLYYQGMVSGSMLISSPLDDTVRLETSMLEPLPYCEILASHAGVIIGSNGKTLYFTRPMLPHLHNPESDYILFPEAIDLIAPVSNGVYVCADKTYFITGIGTAELTQTVVREFGAVRGTGVKLPDTSQAWFCKYGQVIAGPDGQTTLANRESYAPDIAAQGAAGFIEHNGNQMIATTMRGEARGSTLRSRDYWELEIL